MKGKPPVNPRLSISTFYHPVTATKMRDGVTWIQAKYRIFRRCFVGIFWGLLFISTSFQIYLISISEFIAKFQWAHRCHPCSTWRVPADGEQQHSRQWIPISFTLSKPMPVQSLVTLHIFPSIARYGDFLYRFLRIFSPWRSRSWSQLFPTTILRN